jgi:hypothetical protein
VNAPAVYVNVSLFAYLASRCIVYSTAPLAAVIIGKE